jgi:uncharacterized protein (TIGR00255 family)
MTGYGQAKARLEPGAAAAAAPIDVTLELRSVNGRFLDLSFRLPDDLRSHEAALREAIAQRIKRGKVECRAALEVHEESIEAIDERRLAQVLTLQRQVLERAPGATALSASELLRWPGVLTGGSAHRIGDDGGALAAALARATDAAIEQLLASRAREGARLAEFLVERCERIDALADEAAKLAPQAIARQQQRFVERFAEAWNAASAAVGVIGDGLAAARDRAWAEAASYALRIDIAEEIGRLKSHTAEIRELLQRGGELGKRLDFLVQELHREANTLGSKSAGLELTRAAIDLKVAVEQMREQVQNIE